MNTPLSLDSSFLKFTSFFNRLVGSKYSIYLNATYFVGYHLHSNKSQILLLFKVVSTFFEQKRRRRKKDSHRPRFSLKHIHIVQVSQAMTNMPISLDNMSYILFKLHLKLFDENFYSLQIRLTDSGALTDVTEHLMMLGIRLQGHSSSARCRLC